MSKATVVARISNTSKKPIVFVLEPWGEVFGMASDATFEVVNESQSSGALEVHIGERQMTVYGWDESALTVLEDGRRPMVIANERAAAQFLKSASRTGPRDAESTAAKLPVGTKTRRRAAIESSR